MTNFRYLKSQHFLYCENCIRQFFLLIWRVLLVEYFQHYAFCYNFPRPFALCQLITFQKPTFSPWLFPQRHTKMREKHFWLKPPLCSTASYQKKHCTESVRCVLLKYIYDRVSCWLSTPKPTDCNLLCLWQNSCTTYRRYEKDRWKKNHDWRWAKTFPSITPVRSYRAWFNYLLEILASGFKRSSVRKFIRFTLADSFRVLSRD